MIRKISTVTAFLLGLGMIFLGVRFYFSPEMATTGFGIRFNAQGDYSFHYIKGIRDVFSGLLICVFVLLREKRALGLTLSAGTIIPLNDMLIVFSKHYNNISQAIPHMIAAVICLVAGTITSNQTSTTTL